MVNNPLRKCRAGRPGLFAVAGELAGDVVGDVEFAAGAQDPAFQQVLESAAGFLHAVHAKVGGPADVGAEVGRAHGLLGASAEGKKGMQGKETVGVLPCTVDDSRTYQARRNTARNTPRRSEAQPR